MAKRQILVGGLAILGLAGLTTVGFVTWRSPERTIPDPQIFLPEGDVARAAIFLISDGDGWGSPEEAAATELRDKGAIVMGVDLPRYIRRLERLQGDNCLYLVSDIEDLSRKVQRGFGGSDYRLPVIAGEGAGGALALAIAAQTPASTAGGTVAADPTADIPLTRPLCTPAQRHVDRFGESYLLTPGPLPDPMVVLLSPTATEDGRLHADELRAQWPAVELRDISDKPLVALTEALSPKAGDDAAGPLSDLPLAILDATPTQDSMAIVLSGDGGWRDLDKTIAENLQARGIPTAGLDSLRYFWSERTPEQVAADLTRIIETLSAKWNVRQVALIGYSFGADVLPATLKVMDPSVRAKLTQVSLLGFSEQAAFQISVGGWFGFLPQGGRATLPDVKAYDLTRVQCFYGEEEPDTACPALAGTAAEIIKTKGGHHFDGDYDRLADDIAKGLARRAAQPAGG